MRGLIALVRDSSEKSLLEAALSSANSELGYTSFSMTVAGKQTSYSWGSRDGNTSHTVSVERDPDAASGVKRASYSRSERVARSEVGSTVSTIYDAGQRSLLTADFAATSAMEDYLSFYRQTTGNRISYTWSAPDGNATHTVTTDSSSAEPRPGYVRQIRVSREQMIKDLISEGTITGTITETGTGEFEVTGEAKTLYDAILTNIQDAFAAVGIAAGWCAAFFYKSFSGLDLTDISYSWSLAGVSALGLAVSHSLTVLLGGGYRWDVQQTVSRTDGTVEAFGGFGTLTGAQWDNQDVTHTTSYRSSPGGVVRDTESYTITSADGLETRTASRDHARAPFTRTITVQQRGAEYEGKVGDWTVTTSNLGVKIDETTGQITEGFVRIEGRTETVAQMAVRELAPTGGQRETGVTYIINAGIDAVSVDDRGFVVFNETGSHYERSMTIEERDPRTRQRLFRTVQGQEGCWTRTLSNLGAGFIEVTTGSADLTKYSLSMDKYTGDRQVTYFISGYDDASFTTGEFDLSTQTRDWGIHGGDASSVPPSEGKEGVWVDTVSDYGENFSVLDSTSFSRSLVEIDKQGLTTGVTYMIDEYGRDFEEVDTLKYSRSRVEDTLRDQYGQPCQTAGGKCGLWTRVSSNLTAAFDEDSGSKFSRQLTDSADEDITYTVSGYDNTFTTPPAVAISPVTGTTYDPAAVTTLPGSPVIVYDTTTMGGADNATVTVTRTAAGFSYSYTLADNDDAVSAAIRWASFNPETGLADGPGTALGASVVLALSGPDGSVAHVSIVDIKGRSAVFDVTLAGELRNYELQLSGENIPEGFDREHIAGIYFPADKQSMGASGTLTIQAGGLNDSVPPAPVDGFWHRYVRLEYSVTEKEHNAVYGNAVPEIRGNGIRVSSRLRSDFTDDEGRSSTRVSTRSAVRTG